MGAIGRRMVAIGRRMAAIRPTVAAIHARYVAVHPGKQTCLWDGSDMSVHVYVTSDDVCTEKTHATALIPGVERNPG